MLNIECRMYCATLTGGLTGGQTILTGGQIGELLTLWEKQGREERISDSTHGMDGVFSHLI